MSSVDWSYGSRGPRITPSVLGNHVGIEHAQ